MRAVFHKEFNYTSRKVNAGWSVKPNSKPQTLPRECIEAAVAAIEEALASRGLARQTAG